MTAQGLTYEQLVTAFRHGNFQPLYFWFGEEVFLNVSLQHVLVEHALGPSERDFNLDILYGAETDAQDVLARCRSFPMMAPRRVVIVRDFDRLKQKQLFAEYARQPNPHAVVVLACSGRPNLSVNPYRALKQRAAWSEFRPLKERELPGWIEARMQAVGKRLRPEALHALIESAGHDLHTLHQELEKLQTYTGSREEITREDVLAVGGHGREFNVFELQDAIGRGDRVRAFYVVEQILRHTSNRRREALRILAVLTNYFMRLYTLTLCRAKYDAKALGKKIGIPPYYVKEYLHALRLYPLTALEAIMGCLLEAEFSLKGGSEESEAVILTRLLKQIMPDQEAAIRTTRTQTLTV